MISLPERTIVLETKVEAIEEKIDQMGYQIENNQQALLLKLQEMQAASTLQHGELANKITALEGFKNRGILYVVGILAFAAGVGWVHGDLATILKFLGV